MSDSKVHTSLVIMAAGIGSRFGQGIKQLTSFGPGGEIIMDYSIYDALQAGFDRVVFVIRKDLEKDFREVIGSRIEKHVDTAYVFQEKSDLPDGFICPPERKKPWGTGQAILACRGIVNEPFCVINADDYYGKKAFSLIHDELAGGRYQAGSANGSSAQSSALDPGKESSPLPVCMAGFVLKNTLSENGGVTRGVCSVDNLGRLIGIRETKNIARTERGVAAPDESGALMSLDPSALVSMNMWGFDSRFLDELQHGFISFLKTNLGTEKEGKAEYLLPTIVDELLQNSRAQVRVLPTDDRWFGVTYHEDIPTVKESFRKLADDGVYPAKLWT